MDTIAKLELDILISGPCVPQIFFPLMARLAHLQMVLLEPNWPDGIKNSDYYISWRLAEPANYKDFYETPVSLLRTPPYWIERSPLDQKTAILQETGNSIRLRLLNLGPADPVYICANTPPKIHPAMDEMFCKLLEMDPAGFLVFLRGEHSPSQILKSRLREKLGRHFEKVIFLNTLEKVDAHALLLSADCCIDSYPICGMSSSFDGIMLGVPIVTLPADIPFGRWTAAIYEYIGVSGLTARNVDDYVSIAMKLAMDKDWRREKSAEVREKSSCYVESMASFDEFQHFIIQSWRRKQAGLPPGNWVAGEWQ
jgi:predicted O-linked N-acetylglucosamine transferase (SPINDLY family)